jgi:hypothetical protein
MIGLLFMLAARSAAPAASADSLPSCSVVLEGMVAKAEADYAGFVLEGKGARRRQYDSTLAALRVRADSAKADECYFVLHAYAEQFHDPHVFVFQRTFLDSAESAALAAVPKISRLLIAEDTMRRHFTQNAKHLDPIEGIWKSGALRVAVIAGKGNDPGDYVAVVLTPDSATWHTGDIRAYFLRQGRGRYAGQLRETNLATRYVEPTIYKHTLLRFDPGMWAKEFPVAPADSGLVSFEQPQFATLTWRGKTAVLSIPSNDPTYREALFTIVTKNHDAILAAPRMIIDIRGNEGGSSWVTDTVLPFIMSNTKRPAHVPPDDPQLLSSPDNIKYVEQRPENISSDSLSIVRLLARLTENPGALVPIADPLDHVRDSTDSVNAIKPDTMWTDSTPRGPAKVAVLIDGGTVSAAEVFLREARRSMRVIVYGENTAGALDYMSVTIVRVGDTGKRWYLGYPVITARPDLPHMGMRGIGIPPDVRVDWSHTPDAIGWVDAALAKAK